MLVHRFGIFRKPMPANLRMGDICSMVVALCKLHNFCIAKMDVKLSKPDNKDQLNMTSSGGIDWGNYDEDRFKDYPFQHNSCCLVGTDKLAHNHYAFARAH